MRPSPVFVVVTLALAVQASWFGGGGGSNGNNNKEPAYKSWNVDELKAWLQVHNVPLPSEYHHHVSGQTDVLRKAVEDNWKSASAWTYDQYHAAQKTFLDLRDSAFETWDESKLRQFLLEQGIVAPHGQKEYLVLLAKQKYKAYAGAASSFSSMAGETAGSAIYGNKGDQVRKSASSLAATVTSGGSSVITQATREAAKKFDDTKDYVYSNWDENQMRKWLEKKGLLKSKEERKKEEIVRMMHNAWGRVADPVWDAWSDSYIHHWLVQHRIIKEDVVEKRETLVKHMKNYYYATTDAVYDKWSDYELKKWLVDHGIIKSDAQVSRDKMLKLIQNNFVYANDTFWDAWSDSQIRNWLVEHGHLRSDAQVKRDELVKMASDKWFDMSAGTASYLTWPDARLRAYLREHGMDEKFLPTSRPGLLQETRIRWLQTQTRADTVLAKIKEIANSGIYKAEDTLSHLFALLSGGGWEETKADASEKTKGKVAEGQEYLEKKAGEASDWVSEKVNQAKETVGEKVKVGGQKLKGEL